MSTLGRHEKWSEYPEEGSSEVIGKGDSKDETLLRFRTIEWRADHLGDDHEGANQGEDA
jgi:hypothetical protein